MACRVGRQCVELFEGEGTLASNSTAKSFAAARVGPIYSGSNEIMKELISRKILN